MTQTARSLRSQTQDRLFDPARRSWPLAGLRGQRPPAPHWYQQAMAVPVEERRIIVEGAGIEMLCWGEPFWPGVLLIHGSSAHARWWGAVAPLLADRHRVVTFSWSGMGGSDWRERYSVAQTAREAQAVAEAAGLLDDGAKPMVVAHSFGSKAAALLVDALGAKLAGAVFVDSLLVPDEKAPDAPFYRVRHYASEADALERFRLAPDQPCSNLFIADDIARASLKPEGDGWTWRFDPDFYGKLDFSAGWDELARAACPLAFIRGAESLVLLDRDVEAQRTHTRAGTAFIDIPNSHHHVMIDEPIALVAALRTLSECWRPSPSR